MDDTHPPWRERRRRATAARRRAAARQRRWARLGCGLLLASLPAFGNHPPQPLPALEIGPTRGERLMVQYQCGRCHTIPGVPGADGVQGPTLAALGRRTYLAGELPNTLALRARWIVEPAALVPGTTMPSLGVTPEDARAIALALGALR